MDSRGISIVIPSYNGAERLPRTLSSLAGTQVDRGFEVIVVDDGSSDATAAAAEAFAARLPLKVLRHERNRGRAAARNSGIRSALGRVVLLLDDDMQAEPGLAAKHLAAHAQGNPVAAVGRILHDGLDPRVPFQAFQLREEEWRRERLLRTESLAFGDLWTGQMSVDRDLALRAGLFDEEIGSYGLEDIEFAYRLSLAGARFVYLDDAVARHAAYAVELGRYCERHRMVGEVAAYLARRHDTPEMRRYLRLETERPEAPRSLFLNLMNASAALLRRPGVAALLTRRAPQAVLRGGVRILEAARLRRPLAFVYTFMRDIQYFAALGAAASGTGRPEPPL